MTDIQQIGRITVVISRLQNHFGSLESALNYLEQTISNLHHDNKALLVVRMAKSLYSVDTIEFNNSKKYHATLARWTVLYLLQQAGIPRPEIKKHLPYSNTSLSKISRQVDSITTDRTSQQAHPLFFQNLEIIKQKML